MRPAGRRHESMNRCARLMGQPVNPKIYASGVVDAPKRVAEYFSLRAGDYAAQSARFPWAWVRAHERRAVRSLLGDITGADVLELGTGAGFYTRELIRAGARHVWALDISPAMLAALPSGPVTAVLGRAETIRLDRRF